MLSMGLKLNKNGVDKKLQKLTNTSQMMTAQISLKTGQSCITKLIEGSPKGGTGDLDNEFGTRLVSFKWTHRCWVYNTSRYYWYANYGNDKHQNYIVPKRKKALRWFEGGGGTATNYISSLEAGEYGNPQAEMKAAVMGKIFSKKTGTMYSKGQDHRFFKERATFYTRVEHQKIAKMMVSEWLR